MTSHVSQTWTPCVWEGAVIPGPSPSPPRSYYILKRGIDLILATVALVILGPIMLLIALVIRLDSSGPAIFIQERVGSRPSRQGPGSREIVTFRLYKFRSMVANADSALHQAHITAYVSGQLDAGVTPGASFKLAADPRITRVGRWIRRTSLDELPQLLNVLKGDMSLVGPRPVPWYEASLYEPANAERLSVKPGMTGLWQVGGRSQRSFSEMIALDREYARRQSLMLDLSILVRTIPAIFEGQGAS